MRLSLVTITAIFVFWLTVAYSAAQQVSNRKTQVLFICEHGNVKSLMAAAYFNRLAQERGLQYRAVPRGPAPNSTTVPPTILNGLRSDGIDVSSFHPSELRISDIDQSARVITMGIELPKDARSVAQNKLEDWNDVPPATIDYFAARESLKAHITKLVEELANK